MGGKTSAALYLARQSVDPAKGVDRVLETARLLAPRTGRPLLAAALLTAEHPLSPPARGLGGKGGRRRRTLPAREPAGGVPALGIALVEGLPKRTFAKHPDEQRTVNLVDEAATLLALHAWIYRPLHLCMNGSSLRHPPRRPPVAHPPGESENRSRGSTRARQRPGEVITGPTRSSDLNAT